MTNFTSLAREIESVPLKHTTHDFISLYALHQQATVGPNKTPRPAKFDGMGSEKWAAWSALGDMASDVAEHKYVVMAQQVLDKEKKVDLVDVAAARAEERSRFIQSAV